MDGKTMGLALSAITFILTSLYTNNGDGVACEKYFFVKYFAKSFRQINTTAERLLSSLKQDGATSTAVTKTEHVLN